MPVLTKPVERESEPHEDIMNDTRVRKEMGPTGSTRIFMVEVEYTDARITQLRTLKDARAKITVTLNRPCERRLAMWM